MEFSKNITPKIISQFEKATDLTFISDIEAEGNVCFADNPELRSEFKTFFRLLDLKNYHYGLTRTKDYKDLSELKLPKNTNEFWELVKLGKEIR